ncbi:MAG: sulfatase/phosphatase domain-containing protein, partial [Acidobacteriota bacterium]
YAPHTRLAGKPDKVARYRAKPGAGKNRNNPELAAMLESIDEGVGAVMKTLDELKVAGNTILIFTSDNGGELNVTSNAPLRGGKSMLYEGGIRVPLIARWPGVAMKGAECAAPVMTGDFYPTLLEAAGLRPPQGHIVDGVSFAPLLAKPDARLEREALYWYYPLEKPHFLGGRSSGAIRQGDWKLIEFYDKDEVELFNLRDDPGEARNLAEAEPARAQRMVSNLRGWRGHFRP